MNYYSRVCLKQEFAEKWLIENLQKIKFDLAYHRKLWETAAIMKAVDDFVLPKHPSPKGLGFGVGKERLVSYFANFCKFIVATDLDFSNPIAQAWHNGLQHSSNIEDLYYQNVFNGSFEEFKRKVRFSPVDMNNIPEELLQEEFDFTYSSCSFEHLGSIEKGLQFIKNQMNCLKTGGYAIHTTELNCDLEAKVTLDNADTVIFTKNNIDTLFNDLIKMGYEPLSINYDLGNSLEDNFIDVPPYKHNPHLKLAFGKYNTTSIILIIKK